MKWNWTAWLLCFVHISCGGDNAENSSAPVPERIALSEAARTALAVHLDPVTWEVLDATLLDGWPKRVRDPRTEIVFVLVPAGEFSMGSKTYAAEMPRHLVRLTAPFYMSSTELTVGQWRRYVQQHGGDPAPPVGGDDVQLPATSVSWKDAQEFCKTYGYALPTEAEWEYACTFGAPEEDPWWTDAEKLAASSWIQANANERTQPVGQRSPNELGLYDMLGNVWEWCEDTFISGYAVKDPAIPMENPLWIQTPPYRVLRGGSWFTMPPAYPMDRTADLPDARSVFYGVRVIKRFVRRPG